MNEGIGMPGKPKSIDEYLSRLPADQRAALQKLRVMLHAAAPKAEEAINYQIPMLRLGGMLVGFGARKTHCALYTMSKATIPALGDAVKGFDTSMGTIRFSPETPLPASLVKKIVKLRIAENLA
jgi:uncharacterized protein YdhG (YjbR/CyaY superfamily)